MLRIYFIDDAGIIYLLDPHMVEIQIFRRAVYYLLFTEFNSPPNLVKNKGIYSTRAGSILTSAGPAWDRSTYGRA